MTDYIKLKNLHMIPIDAPATGSFEGPIWPRLPMEGEIYIAQDAAGGLYVSFGCRGWIKARPLTPNV